MCCRALLVKVMSMYMWPWRREKVPEISRPFAFTAGSHTCSPKTARVHIKGPQPSVEDVPRSLTAFAGTCPPVVMAMPVDSSNRSFRPLLAAGGAGVGDGAKVLGTDDGMKFWPT